jgi:hypothetical protein
VIAGTVSAIRRLIETSGRLLDAIAAAAPSEPVAAQAWREGMDLHRQAWVDAAARLAMLGALKEDLDPSRAADVLAFLTLPTTWSSLSGYDWTFDEIEAWITATATTLVIQPAPTSIAARRRRQSG